MSDIESDLKDPMTPTSVVSFASMVTTISSSLFWPALSSLQHDLRASDDLVAASASLFILSLGIVPMFWTAVSEIVGRKMCYLGSLAMYVAATAVCSRAPNVGVFIAFRILQASGISSVMAVGAGTLADIYDSHERGTRLAVYYAAPLLGPSLGPLLGGAISNAGGWRATFYFMIGLGVLCIALFLAFPETLRKERSLAWQQAAKRQQSSTQAVRLHPRDVNPFSAVGAVLRQKASFLAIAFSGCLFAAQFATAYEVSRTFSAAPWNYSSIKVGLVLLSFGAGNVVGALGGGKYSDMVLAQLKEKNGGVGEAEMRIKSVTWPLAFTPFLMVGYGWTVQMAVTVYAPIILLFFLGAGMIWIYTATLVYIVDANPGRSASAVACNSLFRGVLAAVASQSADPLVARIGNGWLWTGIALILAVGEVGLVAVSVYGSRWRAEFESKSRLGDKKEWGLDGQATGTLKFKASSLGLTAPVNIPSVLCQPCRIISYGDNMAHMVWTIFEPAGSPLRGRFVQASHNFHQAHQAFQTAARTLDPAHVGAILQHNFYLACPQWDLMFREMMPTLLSGPAAPPSFQAYARSKSPKQLFGSSWDVVITRDTLLRKAKDQYELALGPGQSPSGWKQLAQLHQTLQQRVLFLGEQQLLSKYFAATAKCIKFAQDNTAWHQHAAFEQLKKDLTEHEDSVRTDRHLKSPEENKLINKLDAAILSTIMFGAWIKYIDQTNITNAYNTGMKEDLNLNGNQYTYMQSLYNAALCVLTIPGVMCATYFRPSVWLAGCEIGWMAFTFAQAGAKNAQQMYFFRYVAGQVGSASSGFLQAAIYKSLDGHLGLAGWRWLYIICGLLTVPTAVLIGFILPDFPSNTRSWFISEEEAEMARERCARAGMAEVTGKVDLALVKRIFTSWRVWVIVPTYLVFANSVQINGYYGTWLAQNGFSEENRNLLPALMDVISIPFSFGYGLLADWTGSRWTWMAIPEAVSIIPLGIIAFYPAHRRLMEVAFLFAEICLITPVFFAWINEICHEDAQERAFIVGAVNAMFYMVNTWLPILIFPQVDAPRFRKGFWTTWGFCIASVPLFYIMHLFHKRQMRQEAARHVVNPEHPEATEDDTSSSLKEGKAADTTAVVVTV
ncbi:MFS transporter [Pseudohyphozyma bogoriensis]|nr:MFS transporter [Pseudohyphozyma bogoriensis]